MWPSFLLGSLVDLTIRLISDKQEAGAGGGDKFCTCASSVKLGNPKGSQVVRDFYNIPESFRGGITLK